MHCMKIAQVTHLLLPATGGIEHHVYEISKELVRRNNEVTIFTTAVKDAPKEEKIEGFGIKRFFSLNFPIFSSVRFPPMIFYALLKEDFDIYCSHGYGSLIPFITAVVALIKRKPFVFTLHGYPRQRGALAIFQKIYEMFVAPVFLWKASGIISVSTITPPEMKRYERKIVYIPNGVSGKFACDSSTSDKKAITYIGRLDKDKNIPLLIRGFAKLGSKELLLRICGKDEGAKPELEKLVDELNIDAEFIEIPYERIRKVYCDSKAIVLPSRYEGFPLIWLESIACSRPVFSTRVGDYRHFFSSIFGDDAEQFLFDDEKELAEKLSIFLDNEKEYGAIIRKARQKLMAEYDWKNVAKKTEELYSQAIKKR